MVHLECTVTQNFMRNTYFEYIIKFRVSYGTFIALKPFYVRLLQQNMLIANCVVANNVFTLSQP